MKTIEERARLAARQIFEEIGLSQHSIDRVSEIIAEKLTEQREIDIDKACERMMNFKNVAGEFPLYDYVGNFRKALEE